MTSISFGILLALHEHGEIRGTTRLAEIINAKHEHVLTNAILLQHMGLIDMEFDAECRQGGRGHATIYRDRGILQVQK